MKVTLINIICEIGKLSFLFALKYINKSFIFNFIFKYKT